MTAQKKATIVASLVAICLVTLKLIIGLASGAVVILASAVDSLLDFGVSLFNSYAVSKAQMPDDEKYNYGRGKIEGIASVLEGLIITFSGVGIIYAAVDKLNSKSVTEGLGYSLAVMAICTGITWALVVYLNKVAKRTKSLIIQADALHYKTDLINNVGVMVSLILIWISGLHWIDSVAAILIAVYIIGSAAEVIKKGFGMLLDKALPEEIVHNIKEILDAHVKDENCIINGYHFLKTRESGDVKMVDVHLVFTPITLLKDSHALSDHIEERIKNIDISSKWMILIHQDPYDDSKVEAMEHGHK